MWCAREVLQYYIVRWKRPSLAGCIGRIAVCLSVWWSGHWDIILSESRNQCAFLEHFFLWYPHVPFERPAAPRGKQASKQASRGVCRLVQGWCDDATQQCHILVPPGTCTVQFIWMPRDLASDTTWVYPVAPRVLRTVTKSMTFWVETRDSDIKYYFKNTGKVASDNAVLLFSTDLVKKLTPRYKLLKSFDKHRLSLREKKGPFSYIFVYRYTLFINI